MSETETKAYLKAWQEAKELAQQLSVSLEVGELARMDGATALRMFVDLAGLVGQLAE
jgi:hypothetical protein